MKLGHRPLRNERGLDCHGLGPHTAVLTRAERVPGVGECGADANGARLGVNLAIRREKRPRPWVGVSVSEHQRETASALPRLLRRRAVDPIRDAQIVLFPQGKVRLDGIDLRDRGQERAGPHEVADLSRGDRGDARDERGHFGEPEVELRRIDGRLRRLDGGQRRQIGLDVVVELTLRDRALLGQRAVTGQVALGLPELRLRLAQSRLRLRERHVEGPRIDLEEHLALLDEAAFLVLATHEVARHLRPNLGVDEAVERRDPLGRERDLLERNRDDAQFRRRWRCRRCRALVAPTGQHAQHNDQQGATGAGDLGCTHPEEFQSTLSIIPGRLEIVNRASGELAVDTHRVPTSGCRDPYASDIRPHIGSRISDTS